MTDDGLDGLRAAVRRQTGPARTQPLHALGRELANRYWRAGPGSPTGRPYLDEAIDVLEEAYGFLEPGSYPRGRHAGLLGWLVGTRHVAHAGPPADRERGVVLLDEALGFAQQPRLMLLLYRVVLGQLLVSRVTAGMASGGFALGALGGGAPAAEQASAIRAVACFQEVVDAPEASAELTSMARTLLGMAETLQTLTAGFGGPGGLDIARMGAALAGLQKLQQQASAGPPTVGFGRLPNLFDLAADDLAAADPLERPVTAVAGAAPTVAVSRPHPEPVPATPAVEFRTRLIERLPGRDVSGVHALLVDGAGPPAVGLVDDLVALAAALVAAPGAVRTDELLLAVALYLRSVVDSGGGWNGDAGAADDRRAAVAALSRSAAAVASTPPGTVGAAFRLAELLAAGDRLGAAFAEVAGALRAVHADGLLYQTADGPLLLAAGSGRLARAGAGLPERLLVAGDGALPDGAVVSHVDSGAQVVALAGRARRPVTAAAVFVANPRGDRREATMDALQLRRSFYPRSAGLGETVEDVHAPGTPDDLFARLDASMLHLGCGVTADGGLELAGPAVLDPARIAAGPPAADGGLAVLPPAPAGGAALTAALLASRFSGVIGFRGPVEPDVASLVYQVLHTQLVDVGAEPAQAVAAVRRWLADPHRDRPDQLPPWLADRAGDPDLADPGIRDAVRHHGV